jgi:ABC-type transport system substrate-binding protein
MVEAGYDYTDMTLPATADNHFFNMSILSPNTNPARNTWSAAVAEILPEIGIWVNEHLSTTWGEIGPRTWTRDDPAPSYSEGGFDIFFVGYSWDLDVDPTGLFDSASITPNGDNFYNFNQTEYDGLLLDYTTEMDLTDRITAFKILQAYMYEWEIVAAIVYPQEHWAYYDGITGFDPLLMSISTEEWDLMGTDRQAEGSGFLPLDFTPVLIAMLSVAAAIRFKRH